MGIDIALCLEKQTPSGNWERVERRLDHQVLPGRYREEEPLIARNRTLWDLLAFGVSIKHWDEVIEQFIEPVAWPRGIPDDAASDTRMEYEAQINRGYGFSWLLVKELEDYDWDQEVVYTNRQHLDVENALGPEWIPYGEPFLSGDERPLQDYIKKPGSTYRSVVTHFLDVTLPELQAIGPSNLVRMVFWFW